MVERTRRIDRRTLLLAGAGAAGALASLPALGERAEAAGQRATANAGLVDWSAVDRAMGKQGQMMPGGVWSYSLGRNDIQPKVAGITIQPDFGLDLEVNFQATGPGMAMVMGEIPVLASEAETTISNLLAGGLQFTAFHNHRFEMSPQVWWVHYGGMGSATQMAAATRSALPKGGAAFEQKAQSGSTSLPVNQIKNILGGDAQVSKDGSATFTLDRNDPIFMNGIQIIPSLGVDHHIYFQPIGGGKAAATGELVLEAQEVQAVSKAIRRYGITISALHNHMTTEVPRLFFLHTWAVGNPLHIAQAHRVALNLTNSERASGSSSGSGRGLG